jgi:uncharacterized protein (DUF934 family)
MATLIRRGRACNESWPLLDAAGPVALPETPCDGVVVPLAMWREHRAALARLAAPVGILLQGTDDPGAIAEDLAQMELIAVHFARFSDGRGYSLARLLRGRYGYRGELRAVGDVLRDQLFYLQRVGFDAFELRADQDVNTALQAFKDFTECYQGAIEPALPLFRRRAA